MSIHTKGDAIYDNHDIGLDNIIGIVSLKDLFGKIDDKNFDIRAVASTPYFLPENMSVYTAMERLRNENQRYGLEDLWGAEILYGSDNLFKNWAICFPSMSP